MEEVTCEICGSAEYDVLLNKLWLCEKHNWSKDRIILFYNNVPVNYRNVCCKQCGLVYINPRMTDEETIEFYKRQYREEFTAGKKNESWKLPFTNLHLGIEIYNAVVRYDFLERLGYLREGINTLDIGSSLGALPAYLKAKGCNAYGVEISQFSEYTKDLFGVDTIFKMTFEDFQTDMKFDIITICDALEHFSHPQKVLLKIRYMLKDDGIVLIEVPDIFKPHKALLGFFSNAHLFTFSPNSIRNLLNITGFEVLQFEYGGYCMNMRVIAKKSEAKKMQFKDDFPAIVDFVLRYNKCYSALEEYRRGSLSYESAMAVINETIPEYSVIKFLEALRLIDKGDIAGGKRLLFECLQSDFNEENLCVQKGNIYGLLAIASFNNGDMENAKQFMEKAYELLPRFYDFPYLEELERKGFFDFRGFVFETYLSYIGLSEVREILKKQQSRYNVKNMRKKTGR